MTDGLHFEYFKTVISHNVTSLQPFKLSQLNCVWWRMAPHSSLSTAKN